MEAVQAFVSGKDVIVVLPTGYGKSVIYALLPLLEQQIPPTPPLRTEVSRTTRPDKPDPFFVRALILQAITPCAKKAVWPRETSMHMCSDSGAKLKSSI